MLQRISLRRVADEDELTKFQFPDNVAELHARAAELDGGDSEPDPGAMIGSMPVNPHAVRMLTQFVYMLGIVDSLDAVDNVTSAGKGIYPSVYKVALHQRWCFNHGEEHASNRVYLMVQPLFSVCGREWCLNSEYNLYIV